MSTNSEEFKSGLENVMGVISISSYCPGGWMDLTAVPRGGPSLTSTAWCFWLPKSIWLTAVWRAVPDGIQLGSSYALISHDV